MAIPISYSFRNLLARRTTSLMTALGIGLTVAVLLAVSALAQGLRTSLEASGHPLNLLVTRKGSNAELYSSFTNEAFQALKFKPGIAKDSKGDPAASLELITVIVMESPENPSGINISVRGIEPRGLEIRDGARVSEGRMFTPGRREVVVGKGVAGRYPLARIGSRIPFGRGEWEVVGVLDGGRGMANSEIFCDLRQLASDQNRDNGLSSVLLRAADESSAQALINDLPNDRRLNIDVVREKDYHAQQTQSATPIRAVGTFVALIMAIGSCFAAMNTMYAAVARRSAEIGTLRVLGFPRRSILLSFFLESIFLSILGGIIGCLLVLPLNNVNTAIGSFVTFSEISFDFHVSPKIMLYGVLFAMFMGAVGGLLPAASAARKQILTALRQV